MAAGIVLWTRAPSKLCIASIFHMPCAGFFVVYYVSGLPSVAQQEGRSTALGAQIAITGALSSYVPCTGFFVVYHFFGLPSTASLADLERESRRHCALGWEPLNAARGAEIHMDQYCFR